MDLSSTIHSPTPSRDRALAIAGAEVQKEQAIKRNWYTKRFKIPSTQVVPFAFDQYGRLCDAGVEFVRKIAHTRAVADNNPLAAKYSYLVRRYYEVLSVSTQKQLGSQVTSYSNKYREILNEQKRKLEEGKKKAKNPGGQAGTGTGNE